MLVTTLVAALVLGITSGSPVARRVRIDGQHFVSADTGTEVVLSGPNVVVKGPPYIPSTEGTEACDDIVDAECTATGSCVSCETFNEADVALIKSQNWNFIRLGVVWAGAQPRDEDRLDPDFLDRLHALLNLTDASGIHVMLDNHGDMVGSAGCGNGVPMWFSQKASPDLIGKPLSTGLPYSLIPSLRVTGVNGYDECGDDESRWQQFAGDPNYNILNECCLAMNGPNPAGLGYTRISQAAMDYMVEEGPGRDAFVRYWRLMAEAVVDHPSAFAAELMNEPMSIRRRDMFETWRATAEAINAVIPDMSVALADTGEGAVLPSWLSSSFIGAGIVIKHSTVEWIKSSSTLFYAWHYYGSPSDPHDAAANALAVGADWDVPTFATEFMSCTTWNICEAQNISHSYWHYSSYCTTGEAFGNLTVPDETFGACILGWGAGNSHYSCD